LDFFVNANGRRQRQAKQKFNHLASRQRPNYKMRDAETSARHLAKVVATEHRIRQSSKKKVK
jgi:hypothetical protein